MDRSAQLKITSGRNYGPSPPPARDSNITRTPTAALELRGAFERHPERKREREGEPRPTTLLGDPPATLKPNETTAWKEMQREGFWLTTADSFMIEIAASLIWPADLNERYE